MMGRYFVALVLIFIGLNTTISQCPDLASNVTVNGGNGQSFTVCGTSESFQFQVTDPYLPNGTIDWYSSTNSGFDPLTSGTLVGSSNISSVSPCAPGGCPSIEVIYIDACGPGIESWNEFMVIGSGSGFSVNDLSLYFDDNNIFGSAANGNVNIGGACGWTTGNTTLFSGCPSLIAVGPGDYIPPNSAVIIQTSILGTTVYDVSSLCGVSECVYVLSNSCDRTIGAFSNCGAGTAMGSTRTNEITLACGCSDVLTYDILNAQFLDVCMNIGSDGMHVFSDLTYANNICNIGPNLGSIPQVPLSATVTPFQLTFTNADCNTSKYIVGVLNSSQYNEDCCGEQITNEYSFDISCPTAELVGDAILCPGECQDITVVIIGGDPPYNLNLTLTGLPFPFNNIPITLPGFPFEQKIKICFDTGGPIVDQTNFTVNAPSIAGGFSGILNLNSFTDANGCSGTINGSSVSVSFNNAPDITTPPDQEACDLGNGTGIFILSDMDFIINGGTGDMVSYFSDAMATNPIGDPYITSGGTIYAQILGDPCDSEIVPINLIVITNGDAGVVSFFCENSTGPDQECTICDDDGVLGEEVTLTIIFQNPSVNYNFEVVWSAQSGSSSNIIGSGIGQANIVFNIVETTTFQIIEVTADGDCADMTNLGDPVVINYGQLPQIDMPMDLMDCGSISLPQITGALIPANAAYYDQPNQMGNMYFPNDIITQSTTLYLYAGIEGCDVDFEFDVTILPDALIDDPADIVICGMYQLPNITGTNVDNASYYTGMDGTGSIIPEGTNVTSSILLYLFDPACDSNQPTLDITITPGPIVQNTTDTIVCDMFIVEQIFGMDLSGNEAYFDSTAGNGNMIGVGDTIFTDSLIFIYDEAFGCIIDIPIFIEIKGYSYPGIDSTLSICQGDTTALNLNELLGGSLPDQGGIWLDLSATGVLLDSSQVDISSLGIGTYPFEYQIIDSICIDTSSVLTINILGIPDAGIDASLSICADISGVDIYELLEAANVSGTLFDDSNTPVAFDPKNASFSTANPGTTIYSYVVGDESLSCGADTSYLTVIIGVNVDAGINNTYSACLGSDVDLVSILSENSDLGIFEEQSSTGSVSGGIFSTSNSGTGSFTILHILSGIGDCPADSATLTIIVDDGVEAGNDNSIDLCGNTSVDLSNLVTGDAGGVYYENNINLASPIVNYTNEVGTFEYLYIVGDGFQCPFDTAVISVTRNISPSTFLQIDVVDLCDNECTTIEFDAANNGGQNILLYFHIENNLGDIDNRTQAIGDLQPATMITFCIGAGLLSDNMLAGGANYLFVLDSIDVDNPDCIYDLGTSVSFTTNNSADSTLTGSFCLDSQVMVGNDVYNMSNPVGTTIITNGASNGCDSIIEVNFVFQDFSEGTYTDFGCIGEVISVNGTDYTSSNNTDEFIISNGSVNGCDSLVKIDITFFDNEEVDIQNTICAGDTLLIGGEAFYQGKENGMVVVSGVTSSGCDSIYHVDILIDNPVNSSLQETVCANYSTIINGTTYDGNNPSGIEIFNNQAVNGCDSILTITFDFSLQPIDSSFILSTCDDDFFLVIGNKVFNRTTPSGTALLPSNSSSSCDTTVNVNITYGELSAEYVEIDGSCGSPNIGSVLIEEITGDAPFNISYNGNNTIAFTLPIAIPLPVGSGELIVIDDNGCEIKLPYDILIGGDENFNITENLGQLSITGNQIDSIIWTPTEGLSCIDCLDPIATPDITTEYVATIFYGDSCEAQLMIRVEVIDNVPDYIFPSVFSPNGDNTNDVFKLFITDGTNGSFESMNIFDRWGNLVFSELARIDQGSIGWDGTKNGKALNPGVYVYHVTIREENQIIHLYGDITLVR